MKIKHLPLVISILILSILVSACSSAVYSSTSWHGLTATKDTAYLAAGGQIFAIDLTTHNEKWKYPDKANTKGFYAIPVLTPDGQQLLAPSYDNTLYSLDPSTHQEKWKFPQSSSSDKKSKSRLIASPLVVQDMIFQPSTDSHLYALDLNGNYKWDVATGGPLWAQPATDPNCGCIYVSSMDHLVYKIDTTTGRIIKTSDDLHGALVGTPTVGPDGSIYVGTFGKQMYALDSANMSTKWVVSTLDWVWAGPLLSNNVLYFGDISGNFYALKATDGSAAWPSLKLPSGIVATPVISGDNIYLTTEADALVIVSTGGAIVDSKTIGGSIYSSPVLNGDLILLAPTNYTAQLVVCNLNGIQQWVYPPAK